MAQQAKSLARFSTIQTDPLRNFRFVVDFLPTGDGQPVSGELTTLRGGFTSVSGLAITTNAIGYREGGMNTSLHQVPGMTSFQPLTLTRGTILGNDQAIKWMRSLFAATSGQGLPLGTNPSTTFRCNLAIYVLDHPATGAPQIAAGDLISQQAYKMKFNVYNAWISSLSFSDLNAQGNEIIMETMSLAHEGLSVELASSVRGDYIRT
jgi:phage tail-like protein